MIKYQECDICGNYAKEECSYVRDGKENHRCQDCYNLEQKIAEIRERRLRKREEKDKKKPRKEEQKVQKEIRKKAKEKINIQKIKQMVKETEGITSVDDLLALNKANDPFYIQDNNRKKAEWFRDVWEKEGQKVKYEQWIALGKPQDDKSKQKYLIHPRGLHYQILGGGYQIEISGEIKEYLNTEQCWNYLQKGAKYARLLELVPYESILDEQNPDPKNVPYYWNHEEFEIKDVSIFDDISELQLHSLYFDNVDDFIEDRISDILDDLFSVTYYPLSEQPNYLEIWAEKKGVIPVDVAQEFNASIRPAGSGEFSVDMCFRGVKKAKDEKKDLHIFMLVDFDPKGRDMPKSVSRKVEYIARNLEVNAFVHFVALTKEQCIKYALPTVPAKNPRGNSSGTKGYRTHTEMFKKFAGQDPTELNSFLAREPIAYRDTIREAISPYYDEELEDKFKEEIDRLKENVRNKLEDKFDSGKAELEEIRKELREKYDEINTLLNPIIEKKEQELGLDDLTERYADMVDFNVKELIEDEEFDMPEAEVEDCNNALLDTRRSYLEQIRKYKEFDIRENGE